MKKILVAFLTLLILAFLPKTAFAELARTQNSTFQVVLEKINPGDDYKFILKRLEEKVKLSFFNLFPKKKIVYLSGLTDVRLSELKYVVEKKDIANFQTASQRYSATAGNTTDSLLTNGDDGEKSKFIERLQNHIPVLVKLQEPYVPDNSEWRFLQDNINSLQSYISKLSEKN